METRGTVRRECQIDGISYISLLDELKFACGSNNPTRDFKRLLHASGSKYKNQIRQFVFVGTDGKNKRPTPVIPVDILEHWKDAEPTVFRVKAVTAEMAGWVYLLHFQEMPDVYKIGSTTNVEQRVSAIERVTPFNIVLDWKIQSAKALRLEKILHNKFRKQRVKYEWFRLSPPDVAYIKTTRRLVS